jgi:hypothetical protein
MMVKIMSRRRRIYLLLAALLPTTLGIATFAIVNRSGRTQGESGLPAMGMPEAAPEVVQEAQSIGAPVDHEAEASGATPAAKEAEAPAAAPQAPASNQQSIKDDADDANGPARFADSGPTESAGSFSGSDGSIRLASNGASYAGGGAGGGGGGGGGSRSSDGGKDAQAPQDQQPQVPQDPQGPPGDGTSPGDGKNPPDVTQGGNPPGTNVPNNDGKQDQGPPEGSNEGGPNKTPEDEGGNGETPPFIPDSELEKPVQVPEPATLGLLALGLLGCAARRKARTSDESQLAA